MQKLVLLLAMGIALFAYDVSKQPDPQECLDYKSQYEKYVNKAEENKKMASRYNLIAVQYKSMFDECKKDFYSPSLMMKSAPGVTIKPSKFQQANSYRVNPYNK